MNQTEVESSRCGLMSYPEAYGRMSGLWESAADYVDLHHAGTIDDETLIDNIYRLARQAHQTKAVFRLQQ